MGIPLKKERLNNLQLGYQRNELVYEAVMTDLYLMGVIPKDVCEAFTGRKMSASIRLPVNAEEMDGQVNDSGSNSAS